MSKYKYTLPHNIRKMCEYQLRHYKRDKKELDEYKAQFLPSMAVNYDSLHVSGGTEQRQVEDSVIRMTTSAHVLHLEKSISAVEHALALCDNVDLRIIELVDFRRSHSVIGAGAEVGLTEVPAYNRRNRILMDIALEMGYVDLRGK